MRELLMVIVMVAVVLFGYRLMNRLDRFLDAHVTQDDEHDGK